MKMGESAKDRRLLVREAGFKPTSLISVVAGLAAATDAWTDLRHQLASDGIPTGSGTWSDVGLGAGIASAAAMLLGSMFGGITGDRWHSRLTAAAAESRARAEEAPVDDERPRRELGDDETTIDVRDRTEAMEPSIEEERENARAGRADVGL